MRHIVLKQVVTALALAALWSVGARGRAVGLKFDYRDPKEISAVSLMLDSPLEPIVGYAKGISGTVTFDPAHPKSTTGQVAVDVASIQFANEGYTATARGYALNGEKYPQILFTLRKVLNVTQPSARVYKALVQADFTCHGITTPLTVPVTATYFPGRAEERTNGKYRGDLLILRTHFSVSRTRQGISKGIPNAMVSDRIEVGVAVVGIHYAAGQALPEPAKPAAAPQKTSAVNRGRALAAAGKQTARLWKMEVERNDDPICLEATFDLKPGAPKASFRTAAGSLEAEQVQWNGKRLMFHLPDNPQIGAQEGEAVFENGVMQGAIKGKDGTVRIHGRAKRATDNAALSLSEEEKQGPGFKDLKIEAGGTIWPLTKRMTFHHVPAVSLARIENFKVVEVGAFGVTNVETGEPVDPYTLFQAGGMGSPLVNLLALKLAANGRLDLNRGVNACLKAVKIPENAFTKRRKVTVLDLVNGTSGLTQYKFAGYRPGVKLPTLSELLQGADPYEMEPLEIRKEPGSHFQGAGICGAVLEQVIVEVTGRPLPELMAENLFRPLGMTHSLYDLLPAGAARRVALGHYSTGELTLDRVHFYPETGETGLWTTAGDFATLLSEVQRMLAGKSNRILEAGQRDLLKAVVTKRWALGLIKSEQNDFLPPGYFYHGGASYGFFANHATHQSAGCGLVVMSNRNLSWQLCNEIILAVAKKYAWPQ